MTAIEDVPSCARTTPHVAHDACDGVRLEQLPDAAHDALRTLRAELARLPYAPAVRTVCDLLGIAERMMARLPWHRARLPRPSDRPQGV